MSKKSLALFLSFIMVFSIYFLASENNNSDWTGWGFPIRPDTPEWLETLEHLGHPYAVSRLQAQVPEDVLERMSTEELVDVVLRSPFLMHLYAFSSYAEGAESISRDFNGMRELLTREDRAKYFWDAYEREQMKMTPDTIKSSQILILLSETVIVEELTKDEIEFIEYKMTSSPEEIEIPLTNEK